MSEESKDKNTGNYPQTAKMFFRKGKKSPFLDKGSFDIDYKDPDFLRQFISDGGRMLPARVTGASAKHQRALKKAIKRARNLALLPFTS